MRIYGNRQLKTLPGQQTRPTASRVREALFNIWQGKVAGCRWLDVCAGTGSIGAEALCRGANRVVGIEKSGQACAVIRQNWQQVAQPHQQFQTIRGDAIAQIRALSGKIQFDRIYFDPPYASELYAPVLAAIAGMDATTQTKLPLLTADGEMAVEHAPNAPPMETVGALVLYRQKVYGNSALSFYRLSDGGD
jgi:16S rRNA (guanine(966)-N(2))-methyltransferase RsmD